MAWWRGTVGYEVYIRSFADSTGDGIGDLEGIRSRLEYLAWLGVDTVWVSPFQPGPGFDHGYDVSNYVDVSPLHGDLDAFDRLVADAHQHGLRLVVDLVPNHTSSQHPWFVEALADPASPFRDFYLWRDPAPDGGPPNNWVSYFGGPAWTLDETSGQYYCHLYLPEQPDLNWRNPGVLDAFDDIFRFWCERGVDGFRLDVVHGLLKHPEFPDNPLKRPLIVGMVPKDIFRSYDHRYDLDQDANTAIYQRWADLVKPYGAMLIGEVDVAEPERVARYVVDGALDAVFYLEPVWADWEPAGLLAELGELHSLAPDRISWVSDNHDASRSVTRYGDGDLGLQRSKAVTALMLSLGGVPFLYQGQELGLPNGEVDPADMEDPVTTRNDGIIGRDGARTPMPWDTTPGHGFSTSAQPWLPAADRDPQHCVSEQRADDTSTLSWYRTLLAARKVRPAFWEEAATWQPSTSPLAVAVHRGSVMALCNLGPGPVDIDLPEGTWHVFSNSAPVDWVSAVGSAVVPGECTVLVETG